MPSPS